MSKFPKQVGSFERNVAHKVGKELLTHVMTHMTHEAMGGAFMVMTHKVEGGAPK